MLKLLSFEIGRGMERVSQRDFLIAIGLVMNYVSERQLFTLSHVSSGVRSVSSNVARPLLSKKGVDISAFPPNAPFAVFNCVVNLAMKYVFETAGFPSLWGKINYVTPYFHGRSDRRGVKKGILLLGFSSYELPGVKGKVSDLERSHASELLLAYGSFDRAVEMVSCVNRVSFLAKFVKRALGHDLSESEIQDVLSFTTRIKEGLDSGWECFDLAKELLQHDYVERACDLMSKVRDFFSVKQFVMLLLDEGLSEDAKPFILSLKSLSISSWFQYKQDIFKRLARNEAFDVLDDVASSSEMDTVARSLVEDGDIELGCLVNECSYPEANSYVKFLFYKRVLEQVVESSNQAEDVAVVSEYAQKMNKDYGIRFGQLFLNMGCIEEGIAVLGHFKADSELFELAMSIIKKERVVPSDISNFKRILGEFYYIGDFRLYQLASVLLSKGLVELSLHVLFSSETFSSFNSYIKDARDYKHDELANRLELLLKNVKEERKSEKPDCNAYRIKLSEGDLKRLLLYARVV